MPWLTKYTGSHAQTSVKATCITITPHFTVSTYPEFARSLRQGPTLASVLYSVYNGGVYD